MPLNEIPKYLNPETRKLVESALADAWRELTGGAAPGAASAGGAPAQGAAAGGAPAQSALARGGLAQGASAQGAPARGASEQDASAQGALAQGALAGSDPVRRKMAGTIVALASVGETDPVKLRRFALNAVKGLWKRR